MIATIAKIEATPTGIKVIVTYTEGAFKAQETFMYAYNSGITQVQAVNDIKAKGNEFKATLTTVATLQSKVGTQITI